MQLLIATTSRHKAEEIAALLSPVPNLELLNLSQFPKVAAPEENGATMRENADIKALYYAAHFGLPVLADDSGLEVDALGGGPGVHSARWVEGSDADRTRAILRELQGKEGKARRARYRCAMSLAHAGAILIRTEGTCEGRIAASERGTNGFGYDPIFELTADSGAPEEWLGATVGEAPPSVKAALSHRARAAKSLAVRLRDIELGTTD